MNASATRDTGVLIVGAGPTGLVLALWLTRLGVRVRIVDKTAEPGTTSRALAVQARTLELHNQVGLAEEVIARGRKMIAVNLWSAGKKGLTKETVLKAHGTRVKAVAFHPDGKRIALGGDDTTVRFYEFGWLRNTAKPPLRGHTDAVTCLAFAPDGRTLAAGDYGHTVTLWDPNTGREQGPAGGHHGAVVARGCGHRRARRRRLSGRGRQRLPDRRDRHGRGDRCPRFPRWHRAARGPGRHERRPDPRRDRIGRQPHTHSVAA